MGSSVEQLTDLESFKRLALAMAAGAVLGYERERADKPAGVRTYMLVAEGAALFMMCALLLSQQFTDAGRVSDPGRMASTVIPGIGFIGAGVIITTGKRVIGVTTAAGLWVAAAVGLLAGAGFFTLAVAATVATLVGLLALHRVESWLPGAAPKEPPHRPWE
jgi:putative Mg2+ transporter-C (MgtC) family protein